MDLENLSMHAAFPVTGGAVFSISASTSGFTLIEVMVFLALLGGITTMVLQDSARTMHSSSIDQMVRDIESISSTAWNMKHAFASSTPTSNGGRVIHNAFINNPPTMPTGNSFMHALHGNATVTASNVAVVLSITQLTQSDCNDTISRLDAWNWAIVRVYGTSPTTLKSNASPPYEGDLVTNLTAINHACRIAGANRSLYLERRL